MALFEFSEVKFKDLLDLPALAIEKERITTLVGPSGSGKTTILKLLNKMLSPTGGRIMFNGADLGRVNPVVHRRQVAMLSQSPVIFEGTIRDNLQIGLKFQEKDLPDDTVLLEILERVKLLKPLDSAAQTLSGGEKQRLALGRVLLLDAAVYLLDEPSAALDDQTEELIIEMINAHVRAAKKSLVMVTHSKAIAEEYSDTIIKIINGGRRWQEA
ncbi:MAG: ABC transporter ATP-binding protein [Bacillota bacterium]